jgi:YesN/AraC family two-component response regulator
MNGLELAKRLKHSMMDICIMLLSEHSDFSFVQQALQCGVNDYILKPLMADKLKEIAERIGAAMAEMEMRRYYTSIKTDPGAICTMIREALESGDDQTLPDTSEYLATQKIHRADLMHFGLMFLSTLFDQAEEGVLMRNELEVLRRETLEAYGEIKHVEELLSFVREACSRCMRLCDNGAAASSHVNRMTEYIETHYMDPDLSVAKVSEWVHLSPIYTGALFKKSLGKSVVTYIHEVRIAQAKRMLLDDSISVKEVSVRTGYVAPDYFTRLFSKAVGVTPSRYRSIMLSGGREELR